LTNGELAAAMQYSIQGLNCEDPEGNDLLIRPAVRAVELKKVEGIEDRVCVD
jgi:Mn-containing catalase